MPHDRRYTNPGRAPTKWPEDTKLRVEFANGRMSAHAYEVRHLRWTKTDSEWDVAWFWRA